MILPTVTFIDAACVQCPSRHYRETGLAMGATLCQRSRRVTLNAAKPGIFTAVIFSMARAFGEEPLPSNGCRVPVIPTSLTTPAAT